MKRLMCYWVVTGCLFFSNCAMSHEDGKEIFIPIRGLLSFTLMSPEKAEKIADKAFYFSRFAPLYSQEIDQSYNGYAYNFLEVPCNVKLLHAIADIPTWNLRELQDFIKDNSAKIAIEHLAKAVQLIAYHFACKSIEKIKVKCFESPYGGKAWYPDQPLPKLGWVTIRFYNNQLFISQNYGTFYHVINLNTGSKKSYQYQDEEKKREVLAPLDKNQLLAITYTGKIEKTIRPTYYCSQTSGNQAV